MRNIKPVALFRLVFRLSRNRVYSDTDHRPSGVVLFYWPLTSSRTSVLSIPLRRRLAQPTSSSPECVAWNGQSAILSLGLAFKPSATVVSEINTGVVG